MTRLNRLSDHEENELCAAVAEELADYVQSGDVTLALIRQTLRNCASIHGRGYGSQYLAEMAVENIWQRIQSKVWRKALALST